MAIDYGLKRTGIAVTDPSQLIASPLTTVDTGTVLKYVEEYCRDEIVETIVIGLPLRLNRETTHATQPAISFSEKLKKKLPQMRIEFEEEQFSSKKAMETLIEGGMKKKERRKKENIDKVSAAIILQSYLEHK